MRARSTTGFPRIRASSISFFTGEFPERPCSRGSRVLGADHHMHSTSVVEISDHLPVKIEFIESREKVNEILGKLEELAGSGMIEVQETTLAKPAQVSKPKRPRLAHI
ncbi:MAG: DUF190 domain-containing protein [Acidobacteriaceae bacterium]